MKIRSKFAILVMEDLDGNRVEIDKIDLNNSGVLCNYGDWWANDNPGEPEEPHNTETVKRDFREWLCGEGAEVDWAWED